MYPLSQLDKGYALNLFESQIQAPSRKNLTLIMPKDFLFFSRDVLFLSRLSRYVVKKFPDD